MALFLCGDRSPPPLLISLKYSEALAFVHAKEGFSKAFSQKVSLIFPRVQFKGNVNAGQMGAGEDRACQKEFSLRLSTICTRTHMQRRKKERTVCKLVEIRAGGALNQTDLISREIRWMDLSARSCLCTLCYEVPLRPDRSMHTMLPGFWHSSQI